MKKLFTFLLVAPCFVMAQEGVNFEQNLSWQQIQAKAKAEHKMIFMDCFTTWCGPCRYMSSTIFPQKVVADLMNEKFINVKVQLDTTDADNEAVKSWYQTGHDLAAKYDIRAYPTYLFFDENGKAVQRLVGSTQTGEEFVKRVNTAFDPDKQYYTLLDKYNAGKKDPAFLLTLANAAQDAYDMKQANTIAAAYLATQNDLYTKDNLEFIKNFTNSSKDKGFDVFLNHADKADAILGAGTSDGIVSNIILREDIYPVLFAKRVANPKDLPEPDWGALSTSLEKKYPTKAKEAISYAQVIFYENKQDWERFSPAVVSYMKEYGSKASSSQLNSFAWNIFLNCNDMACVQQALDWSKRSIDENQEPAFMDTYANILYKLGRKDEALEWENKAMSAASENDKKTYQETIDKMKTGEKTWN
jgi:thioredoxin-related protein